MRDLLVRKNYEIDQGTGFRDQRRLVVDGVGANFAGATAVMDLRVDPDSPLPTISVNLIQSASGLVGLDTLGNYWWDVYPSALAVLSPLQRALHFCFRVTWADGVHKDDLIAGMLFQRTNLVIP